MIKTFSTILFMLFATIAQASSLPVSGNGAWLQNDNINNQWAFNDVFHWYLVPSQLMEDARIQSLDRPVILAFMGRELEEESPATCPGCLRFPRNHGKSITRLTSRGLSV